MSTVDCPMCGSRHNERWCPSRGCVPQFEDGETILEFGYDENDDAFETPAKFKKRTIPLTDNLQ